MEGYISTQEAAEELGVTPRRVLALITDGRLPAQKIGEGRRSIYLIRRADLKLVKHRPPGRPKGKPPGK